MPPLATSGTKLIIGGNNNFPDDIKPGLMGSKSQHDQVSISAINAVTLVGIVVG